jgi:hypothetical protein
MRTFSTAAALLGAALVTQASRAGGPDGFRGIEVGARAGYAIPYGSAQKGESEGGDLPGVVPLVLAVGFRFNRHWYAGAYGSLGPDTHGTGTVRFGASIAYHLRPVHFLDPWISAGAGWEAMGPTRGPEGYEGWNFLEIEGGVDAKLMSALGVGPFVGMSLGEYDQRQDLIGEPYHSIATPALHGWFTFGLRGAFDIRF